MYIRRCIFNYSSTIIIIPCILLSKYYTHTHTHTHTVLLLDVYAAIISASVVSFVVFIVIVTTVVVLICCCLCGCCAALYHCIRRKSRDRTEINSGGDGAQMTVVNSNQTLQLWNHCSGTTAEFSTRTKRN